MIFEKREGVLHITYLAEFPALLLDMRLCYPEAKGFGFPWRAHLVAMWTS